VNDNLALQVSHGYLNSPEAIEPDADVQRTTASAVYNYRFANDTNWSSSVVWGRNDNTHEGVADSFLVETNFQRGRDTLYGRWERVEKSGHELSLSAADEAKVFPIQAYTIGYVRDLTHGSGIDVGLGGQLTINTKPDGLDRYYGDDLPYSFQVFFRVRPSLMSEHAMTSGSGPAK
jgi:hypothetical protein